MGRLSKFTMGAIGFDVLLGSLTTTGSLIAFAKLQGMLPGRPLTYRGQNIFNLSLLGVIIVAFIVLIFQPGATLLFYLLLSSPWFSESCWCSRSAPRICRW